eukprot:sb/3464650/
MIWKTIRGKYAVLGLSPYENREAMMERLISTNCWYSHLSVTYAFTKYFNPRFLDDITVIGATGRPTLYQTVVDMTRALETDGGEVRNIGPRFRDTLGERLLTSLVPGLCVDIDVTEDLPTVSCPATLGLTRLQKYAVLGLSPYENREAMMERLISTNCWYSHLSVTYAFTKYFNARFLDDITVIGATGRPTLYQTVVDMTRALETDGGEVRNSILTYFILHTVGPRFRDTLGERLLLFKNNVTEDLPTVSCPATLGLTRLQVHELVQEFTRYNKPFFLLIAEGMPDPLVPLIDGKYAVLGLSPYENREAMMERLISTNCWYSHLSVTYAFTKYFNPRFLDDITVIGATGRPTLYQTVVDMTRALETDGGEVRNIGPRFRDTLGERLLTSLVPGLCVDIDVTEDLPTVSCPATLGLTRLQSIPIIHLDKLALLNGGGRLKLKFPTPSSF